jgi:hypothetical protein
MFPVNRPFVLSVTPGAQHTRVHDPFSLVTLHRTVGESVGSLAQPQADHVQPPQQSATLEHGDVGHREQFELAGEIPEIVEHIVNGARHPEQVLTVQRRSQCVHEPAASAVTTVFDVDHPCRAVTGSVSSASTVRMIPKAAWPRAATSSAMPSDTEATRADMDASAATG